MKKAIKVISIIIGILLLLFLISIPVVNYIYEGQKEKSRDTIRLSNILGLRTAIEMYYQDVGVYPDMLEEKELLDYIPNIPIDEKKGEVINSCEFGYMYEVLDDRNGLKKSAYRLSICLESEDNQEKAKNDGGVDNKKYEIGTYL